MTEFGVVATVDYVLLQVMTGESWSEACARPLLFGLEQNNGVQVHEHDVEDTFWTHSYVSQYARIHTHIGMCICIRT